ncbi:2-hydroxyglutaryl-CoA dehydratase, D-component [Peptococcaceae bacterium CEB3]|nr:2-hydroxyglutaryl-CoA dehydratase, D-component [Peptococcaceae bacterium CEB3]
MKVTFPHMGNAWIVIQALFEALDVEVVVPPPTGKGTLNLGTKLAPESACLPLKINLGNYIEAAAKGADTIVITGGTGPCRFGFYGESERQILADAGYDFEVVILEPPDGSLWGLAQRIRYLAGSKNSWARIVGAVRFAYEKSVVLDQVEDLVHAARPRFGDAVAAEKLYAKARQHLIEGTSYTSLHQVPLRLAQAIRDHQAAGGSGDKEPLRVGIVGEIYTILEPFASLDVEQQLGALGVEVDRSIYLSGWVGQHVFRGLAQGYRPLRAYPRLAKPYLGHFVGGHGLETVGAAVNFARRGFDGIIQLLPLGCMPEIVAAGILPRIQADFSIPIMTLTLDEHTGRAGLQTRVEAFVDLLERRKSGRLKRGSVLSVAGK